MNGLLKKHVWGESIWEQHRLQIHTQSDGCRFMQLLMECPLHLQSICTSVNLPCTWKFHQEQVPPGLDLWEGWRGRLGR